MRAGESGGPQQSGESRRALAGASAMAMARAVAMAAMATASVANAGGNEIASVGESGGLTVAATLVANVCGGGDGDGDA